MTSKRGLGRMGATVSLLIAAGAAAGLSACGDSSGDSTSSGGGGASGGTSTGASAGGNAGHAAGGSAGSNASAGATAHGGSGGGSGGSSATGGTVGTAGTGNVAGDTSSPGGADNAGAAGAGGEPIQPISAEAMKLLKLMSPLPAVPADTTNAYADSVDARKLGQELFFDKRYSGGLSVTSDLGTGAASGAGDAGKVSCASCHSTTSAYLTDDRSLPNNVSLGTDFHTRNAPAIVNSSFYTWTNWAGRFSAQWELPPAVAENAIIMNSNRLKIAHFIYDQYKADYEAAFATTLDPAFASTATDAARFPPNGKPKPVAVPTPPDGPWETMTAGDRTIVNTIFVNFGKALEAYMRQLVSRDAPFDKLIANDESALSNSARRGAELFVGKARCVVCHNGPDFTDNQFHNLGVPQTGAHVPATDDGRFKDAVTLLGSTLNSAGVFSDDLTTGRLAGLTNPMPASTKAQFRTASLRGVAATSPYMHSGQFATLADVVSFYNDGGGAVATGTTKDSLVVPLLLDTAEQLDLIEFLKSLSGARVPDPLLVDTSGT